MTLTPPAVRNASIVGFGAFRPERVVTNAEICTQIDSTDEWIVDRSGIRERRHAAPDESVIFMASRAAERAIADAGIGVDQVGLVLLASFSYPYLSPAAATQVAVEIGAEGVPAFDISAACAGFCYGVGVAGDIVRSGNAGYAVVVGAERITDWYDHTDRTLAFLFGDGAGAVVIGPSEQPGIGPTVWGSDGTKTDALGIGPSFLDQRADPEHNVPMLYMQGQTIFRWAISTMVDVARQAIEAAGLTPDQLDAFVPHQANNRITDALVKALDLPERVQIARDVVWQGNTSAASVPLAIDRMRAEGMLRSGDTALLLGFGAGLAYAAQVVVVP